MKKPIKIILSAIFILIVALNVGFSTLSNEADKGVYSVQAGLEDVEAPSINIIPPDELQLNDRYIKFSAVVKDNGALKAMDAVVVYYRPDESLPYDKAVLVKEEGTDIYSVKVDTYVHYGTAKENKKFFTDKIFYYIEAIDANNNINTTQVNIVKCKQYYGEAEDYSKMPYLLITELVVASSVKGIGNGDRFEFVEIYNNSDAPIDFSGYELHYMTNPSIRPTEFTLQNPDNRQMIIPPQEAIVIWVNTNDWQNKRALPSQEMLEHYYGTKQNPKTKWNLVTDMEFVTEGTNANLSYVHFAGQPNSGQHRGWGINTNTGELVVEAYYNQNNDTSNNTDVSTDMSIQFRYPTDGGKKMQKISANTTYGNPGVVLNYQVPTATVNFPEDKEMPVINYNHKDIDIFTVESDGIDHEIWTNVTDDTIINTVYIEYKIVNSEYDSPFTTLQSFLRDGETSFYCAYMDFGKFIRQSKMEFRIEARDIVGNITRSEWYIINIIPYEDPIKNSGLGSNIKEGEFVSGDVVLSGINGEGASDDIFMSLNGNPVDGKPDSERYALFVYEVVKTDFNFRNGVTIKNNNKDHKILFNFDISGRWTTYTVRIPLDMILPSEGNTQGGMIGLHSGSRYTPVYDNARFLAAIDAYRTAKLVNDKAGMLAAQQDFIYGDNVSNKDYPQEINEAGLNLNRDDYDFRNVRLVLSNGIVLYDKNPANNGKYQAQDYDQIYSLGDSNAGDTRQVYFKFDIPETHINTKSYRIDSTTLEDGMHTLGLSNGVENKTINFFIDNTAPEFSFNFENGELLKGLLDLTPNIIEDGSGVGKRYGYLDGNRVGIPYYIKSGDIDAGLHTLVVTIEDKVGNSTTKTFTFETEEENPNPPVLLDKNKKVEGADTQLSVKVTDPSNDSMKVDFFQGYKYSANNLQTFKGFFNNVDVEPIPYVVYPGEVEFTAEQYNKISAVDGNYMDTESYQLPYHRFAVNVDASIPRNGVVDVRWYGKSLEGRKVTLYAWDIIEEEWVTIDYLIAPAGDFVLEGSLIIETYVNVKDNVVNILVQDEIPAPSTDKFSFAWVTDQQYYSQRDAYDDEDHILFELQMNWLIQNKTNINLKYLFNTGDIINRKSDDYQWDIASEYHTLLENARIPHGVLAGNHDVDFSQEDYSKFGEVFGEDRYKNKSWYGESYQNNKGHYDNISVNGVDFMMVYMGWGIYEAEIDWMNKVISQNPDKIVILNFHEYLGTTGVPTIIGQEIYDEVVVPNPNVRMVLCGHLHGSSSRVDEIDDDGDGIPDRKVWQLLANYQGTKNTSSKYDGGDGFIRLFEFDMETGEVSVTSFSPWLEYLNDLRGLKEGEEGYHNPFKALGNLDFEGLRDDSLAQNGNGTGSAYKSMDVETNSFVYEWELLPQIKRVATDALFVYYRDVKSLGSVENVASGDTASIDWKGLEENKEHFWYVVITDDNGGKYISDMYIVTTGDIKGTMAPWLTGIIIGGGVLLLAGTTFAVIFIVRKKKLGAKKL